MPEYRTKVEWQDGEKEGSGWSEQHSIVASGMDVALRILSAYVIQEGDKNFPFAFAKAVAIEEVTECAIPVLVETIDGYRKP